MSHLQHLVTLRKRQVCISALAGNCFSLLHQRRCLQLNTSTNTSQCSMHFGQEIYRQQLSLRRRLRRRLRLQHASISTSHRVQMVRLRNRTHMYLYCHLLHLLHLSTISQHPQSMI